MDNFFGLWEIWRLVSELLLWVSVYAFLIPVIWRKRLEPENIPKFRKVLLASCGTVILGHIGFPLTAQFIVYPGSDNALEIRLAVQQMLMLGIILYFTQRHLKKLPVKLNQEQTESQEDV